MKVAVTGGTGFVGRALIAELISQGHQVRAWYRQTSNRDGFEKYADHLEWIPGELGDEQASAELIEGCDAVVHSALYREGAGWSGSEGNIKTFLEKNFLGSLLLIDAAHQKQIDRFVFVSTCAVHDRILDDRPLDEAHPLWPRSHYGAHKAAIEKFVHSYGFGQEYSICSLRPTGIYGLEWDVTQSKWYELVQDIAAGKNVFCERGGKEVHVKDVARALVVLLSAPKVAGQAYNCYDQYISDFQVAEIAKELTGSTSQIEGEKKTPKNQIVTDKLKALGMEFGGRELLLQTIQDMLSHVR